MIPLKKRPFGVSQVASDSSSGNSRPSLRRPITSTVLPIRREAATPPSTTRLMPASCSGAKSLGHEHRQRLADHLGLGVAEDPLGAAVPRDQSPESSAATIASVADSATERKRVSESRRASSVSMFWMTRPSWRPMWAVTSSRRGSGCDRVDREAFDDRVAALGGDDGEREGAAQTDLLAHRPAREVGVLGDVDDPGRAAAGQHAPGKTDAGGQRRVLGDPAEGGEAVGLGEMPDAGRLERVLDLLAGHVHVTDGPAGPLADAAHGGEHRLLDRPRLRRRGGDTLDQLHE